VSIIRLCSEFGFLLSFSDYAEYVTQGKGLDSVASIRPDGRISLRFDLKDGVSDMPQEHGQDVEEFAVDEKEWKLCPKMNIVIMIVGSRGMSIESSSLISVLTLSRRRSTIHCAWPTISQGWTSRTNRNTRGLQ
jgi:hypothetical protein